MKKTDEYSALRVRTTKILMIMKLSFALLVCAFMSVSASMYSQSERLNLNMKNARISNVLKAIEDQSDFFFFFNNKELNANKKIDINVKNTLITEVLDELVRGENLDYEIMDRYIVIANRAKLKNAVTQATKKLVKGTIRDQSGEVLPGVSIMIKGTDKGITSDANGKYTIDVKTGNETLVFTFIGMKKQEVSLSGRKIVDIVMQEDLSALDEVVVVGYGTQKKINLTGAVDIVDSKTLKNRPVANVQQAIQGAVPNLLLTVGNSGGEPGASMGMSLRGVGSLGGGSPYILVDGMPLDNASELNDINPEDIESISVLKDAASTAIYGARAAFGVILITTKSGESMDGVKLKYSNNFVFASPLKTPDMLNSLEFANYFNEAAKNDGATPVFSEETINLIKAHMDDPSKTPGTRPNPNKMTDWLGYTEANANTDWFDVMYKDVVQRQQHNFSVSGKQKSVKYFISASYYNHEGIMNYGDDQYDRYTVNSKLLTDITSWMRVNFNLRYSRTEIDRPSHDRGLYLHNIARRWPTNPVTAPNGDYYWSSEIPYLLNGGRYNNQDDNYNVSLGTEIEPIKNFKINAVLNYRNGAYISSNHTAKLSYRGPENHINWLRDRNSYSSYASKNYYFSPNIFASYEKTIKGNYFKVMGGFQQEFREYKNLYSSNNDLVTDNVPSISTSVGENDNVDDGKGHWATRGYFGRFNYNYREKYLFEANFRYDGSSRFPDSDRWGLFPSFSAAYNIAKEDFWPIEEISLLKVRASYGSLGNQNVANYLYVPRIGIGKQNWWIMGNKRPTYTTMPGLISPNLTWEKVSTKNLGLDVVALKDRLTTTFEVFERETIDMVGPAESYPSVLGIDPPKSNNAELVTKGFGLTIKWRDNIGDFNYSASFSISNAMTEITSYKNPNKLLNTYREGQKLGEIWGYETHGIFQSDEEADKWADQSAINGQKWQAGDIAYTDLNGDGKITKGKETVDDPGDRKIIGNSTPQFPYAFQFSCNWKGIDMSMLWQGVGKRDVWIGGPYFWGASGGMWQSAGFKQHLNYWTPENKGAYYPRPYFGQGWKNQQVQTKYLQNGAYLRLKNIQVGYTVPENIIKYAKLKKIRVFVAAENILTFTDMSEIFDPETTGGYWGSGKIYPLQKTYSIGLNIEF